MLHDVESQNELFAELNEWLKSGSEYIFIMASASWCGPCKMLKNHFKSISSDKVKKILYVDIDNEEFENFVRLFNVSSIPTGLVLKSGDGEINTLTDISVFLEKIVSGYKPDVYNNYLK